MKSIYFKYGEDGRLLSTLHLEADEAAEQGNVTQDPPEFEEGTWPIREGSKWVNRQLAARQDTPTEKRRMQYPAVTEQLDMLWHAMHNGEIPVASVFYDSIKDVKDAYPVAPKLFKVGAMPE